MCFAWRPILSIFVSCLHTLILLNQKNACYLLFICNCFWIAPLSLCYFLVASCAEGLRLFIIFKLFVKLRFHWNYIEELLCFCYLIPKMFLKVSVTNTDCFFLSRISISSGTFQKTIQGNRSKLPFVIVIVEANKN